jgi:uncharacterized membrane protein
VDRQFEQAKSNEQVAGWLSRWRGWPLVFLAAVVAPWVVLLALPWPVEGKALAVVHGICAQQPDHSFYFGENRLPFDARMTGIYGGFAVTCLCLLAFGKWRATGLPSRLAGGAAIAGVLLLGIDGVNSTLKDLGLWYAYEPLNALRLATGLGTGFALALFVWLLVSQLGFQRPSRRPVSVLGSGGEFAVTVTALTGFGLLVWTGWSPLRLPFTILLISSTLLALTGLMLAFVLLVSRRENTAADTWQLAAPATMALALALALLAGTSGSRFLVEAYAGVQSTVS